MLWLLMPSSLPSGEMPHGGRKLQMEIEAWTLEAMPRALTQDPVTNQIKDNIMRQQNMANHWWWRPGWKSGRRFYTWHITFQNAPDVHRIAQAYREGLAGVPGLDLVPDRWLHLTMQGLGFVDEVAEEDARAIVEAASRRLGNILAFELKFERPGITPEAIRWEVTPAEPPAAVRRAIRQAIAEVWPSVPEPEEGFAPHVTIAYSSAEGPSAPVAAALASVETAPAAAQIDSAELIVLGRDRQMYEWEPFASVPLAKP
ncbi:2'-5' RNA ligase family protein [Thermoactinospora rubra]|uniref:2'-5' RNA ligase family protein n=1 Tax=Thermoactinospora rubra TaxID=1088767 RepID=UPI00197D10E2|nr:2'-5' RNA ligase family protein [Thermoactinospora rubra]